MFYTYILKGSVWKLYVWYTENLERRLKEHCDKRNSKYTSRLWDIMLAWYFEFQTKTEAISFEKHIKKSGHIKRFLDHEKFIKMGH